MHRRGTDHNTGERELFFFWGFPFVFLLPLIFAVLVFRIGSRFFRSRDQEVDERYWHTGDLEGGMYDSPRYRRVLGMEQRKSKEAQIFKLAYRLKGRITISDIVVETGLSIDQSEELIEHMVDGVRVRMEVNQKGMVVYEFPEILERFESGET
jgi:hypothetical protein